jgi:predicted dehydrogenase
MKVVVIGEGFGGRVVAPIYRRLGFDTLVVSPRDGAAVRIAIAADVDLVSVHSPPFLHLAHVMQAIEHGRAVLCDKPFGRDATEARAMRDHARAAGVRNFVNYEFRRQPSRLKLKGLLTDGAIGALEHISWTFIGDGLRNQRHRWLFDAAQSGGWIGAYGSHAIDTLRWLFEGEIAQCGGVSRIEKAERPGGDGGKVASTAEDAFTSWFVMDNGCTASFDTAFSAGARVPQRMILMGSEGSLELLNEVAIILRRPGQPEETFDFPLPPGDLHDPALIPWLTEVRDALRNGSRLTPSFDDGVAAAEAMDLLRSNLIPAGRARSAARAG